MLVPEIALTPQVAALFRRRFGSHVAIQHSGLSDGERHDQWHRIRRGDVDVVVGTRSAVFTPVADPGLIVVDEEHDTSYKQEDTPRYHGRDVAVMRGKLSGALVVLGSATPSMESFANARAGRYTLVSMSRRVLDRPMAEVSIVNMREEMAEEPEVVLSRPLVEGLGRRLQAGGAGGDPAQPPWVRHRHVLPSVRPHAGVPQLQCVPDGASRGRGDRTTKHVVGNAGGMPPPEDRRGWRARCHYCNHVRPVPNTCPQCAAPYLEHVGFGTERIEAEVHRHFPEARVARVDRDTVRRKGSLVDVLGRFGRREVDVLVGTQMIAKGHDFPHVTLVGVVSADVGLGLADFRAAERTFQLLTQVAGRSGRGTTPGEAIVQTLFPTHYSIRLACTQDYPSFFDKETAYRLAMRYPPHVAMVNVVTKAPYLRRGHAGGAEPGRGTPRGRAPWIRPARAGPGAAHRASRRASRAVLPQGSEPHRDARGAARRARRRTRLTRRASVDVDPVTML